MEHGAAEPKQKMDQEHNQGIMRLRIGTRQVRIDFCRGIHGRCRWSLAGRLCIPEKFDRLISRMDCVERIEDETDILTHSQVKISLAACPNACTMPQIKDVGILTERRVQTVTSDCTRCSRCVSVCREKAVRLAAALPEWDRKRCVGCGACISQCPQTAVRPHPVQFRFLVGGRMGRHPRWAQPLCRVGQRNFSAVLEKLFTAIDTHLSETPRFADMIEQYGMNRLKERILYA